MMRSRLLLLLFLVCGQAACASSVPIPFLLVTERVDGVVRDGLTGKPIAGARVCMTFRARETAFIESLAPDRFGYTHGLAGVGYAATDAAGEFGSRAVIPHFSPVGWSEGWDHVLVVAEGYGPLVAYSLPREGETHAALLQGVGPSNPDRRATLDNLQLFPGDSTPPYSSSTPAGWMAGFCRRDRLSSDE